MLKYWRVNHFKAGVISLLISLTTVWRFCVNFWVILGKRYSFSKETWLFWTWLKQPCVVRTNTFKMADRCGEEASAQKNKNWGYYESKWLVKIWADEIQRQLSTMSRKQNIWENIAQNLLRLSITWELKNSKLNGHMCFSLPSSNCSAAPLSFRLCCLNFAQRFASITAPSVGISRKLGGRRKFDWR